MTETHHDLIDNTWFPHGNYDEWEIIPEFIEKHVSIRDLGYYTGSWPDIAASYGYCLTMQEHHSIYEQAHFATKAMVAINLFKGRELTSYQQLEFNSAYEQGFMEGQTEVAKQLYDLALMGEYKAIDKFLEVRGAFGKEQKDTGSPVQITLSKEVEGTTIDHSNVINLLSNKN